MLSGWPCSPGGGAQAAPLLKVGLHQVTSPVTSALDSAVKPPCARAYSLLDVRLHAPWARCSLHQQPAGLWACLQLKPGAVLCKC